MERLLAIDITLSQRFALSPKTPWWQVAAFVAHLGDGPYVFGSLGAIYLLGWIVSAPNLRQSILIIVLAVTLAMAVVTAIKYAIQRTRPHPPGEFVKFQYDIYSFPSGHSARMAALAISTLFFYLVPGWILIVLTIGVAAARMAVGVHYLSDVIVGLGVGIVLSWTVTPVLLDML